MIRILLTVPYKFKFDLFWPTSSDDLANGKEKTGPNKNSVTTKIPSITLPVL